MPTQNVTWSGSVATKTYLKSSFFVTLLADKKVKSSDKSKYGKQIELLELIVAVLLLKKVCYFK